MKREEALKDLYSRSQHNRLKAARFLARNSLSSDLVELQKARQVEDVSYVKVSLDAAIERLSNAQYVMQPDPINETPVQEEVKQQIKNQAIEWIAGLLLHEIAKPVGLAKLNASREIPFYDSSKTKQHFDSLQRIFNAIEKLKGAARTPKPEQFDLAGLTTKIVGEETQDTNIIEISLLGPKPLMITNDPDLLGLAIRNGLINAIEAVETFATNESHPIIITWGETDIDYWVAIIDRGVGVVGPIEFAFEIGKTTKKGHSGFGLAVARQAIETLNGTVTLKPNSGGGTLYEMRWER